MFEIFRRRVGAKIVLGYLASMSLMVIVAILVAIRLTQITVTVNDLANSQAVDVELSNTIVNQIALARLYANRYISYQSQADMDAYQVVFAQLQAALIQADQKITQPDRVSLLRQINTAVGDYDATFDQITQLLAQRQQIKSQVLDVQDLVIENELTALRVNLSANGSTLFLAYGNAQNAVQSMRLNVLKYLAGGDARYVVLFDKGYQQALAALANLEAAQTDPGELRNNSNAQAAVSQYAQGFKAIQPGYAQQTQLAQQLETLESSISQSASEIALQARLDSEDKNVTTQAFVAQTQLIFLATILGAIAIGLFLGWAISRGITTPLQEVMQTAQHIVKVDLKTMSSELVSLSEGKLALGLEMTAAPLNVRSSDEVGQTARAFNEIIFSLQLAEQSFHNMTAYLNEMADAARSVAQGQLDVNVAVRSPQDVLGNALAAMIVNLRASQAQVRRQFQQLAALRQIDALIISSFELELTLKYLAQEATRQLGVDAAEVVLFDAPTRHLECVARHGFTSADVTPAYSLEKSCAGQVVVQNQSLNINNLAETQFTGEQAMGFVAYYGTPLRVKGHVKGVLQVFHHAPLQPGDEWLNYLETLAGQAAIAIDNTELVRGLEGRVAERTAELKESLKALREAHDLAEERSQAAESAARAKSIFLTNMSHELRTPLSAILGFSDLMARDPALSAEQQENLAIINRSGEHLLNLINNVLDMAKIESGRMVLQAQVFDLQHLLNNVADMFRLRAGDKGLSLIVDCAADVPRYVRTDEGKLRQVLINLLGNAVKFTSEGGVSLRVRNTPHETRPTEIPGPPSSTVRWLSFEVQDTGPGIAPEDLDTIFEPFVQSTSGYKSTEGTGLGLPIARQFARLMGGELALAPVDARRSGALFSLSLPVELVMASDLAHLQPAQKPRAIKLEPDQRAPDRDPVPGGLYRVLVVEDHEESRKLLVKLLTQLGFEVRAAAHGLEGVNVWREWQPHLIWMDMRMPVMDGHEATRHIKATPQGQATIVIALTATAFEDQRELILAEGCDDFVRKPYRESDIVEALVKHLGVRFIYAGESDASQPSALSRGALDLTGLPTAWLADLTQAAIAADADRVVALAEQIRAAQPERAAALIDRINSFDLDAILEASGALDLQEVAGE